MRNVQFCAEKSGWTQSGQKFQTFDRFNENSVTLQKDFLDLEF